MRGKNIAFSSKHTDHAHQNHVRSSATSYIAPRGVRKWLVRALPARCALKALFVATTATNGFCVTLLLRSNNCDLEINSQFAIIRRSHPKPVLQYLVGGGGMAGEGVWQGRGCGRGGGVTGEGVWQGRGE